MSILNPAALLLIVLTWPLILTFLLLIQWGSSFTRSMAPLAALPALIFPLLIVGDVVVDMPWVLLGSELGLDAAGRGFLLSAALLWTAAGVYAKAYFVQPSQRTRFYVFFLLAMSGNFGLILAQDLPGFYLGFALMSFAAYGLVVFEGNSTALKAGRVYIVLVVVGEILLFVTMILAAKTTSVLTFDDVRTGLINANHRDLVILLAILGFGIKVGILGLHVWLPLAHPVAPTPASAVLSGTMIKAGVLGWLRLLPLGEVALPGWGFSLIVLGLSATFYGMFVGLSQNQPKVLLAYSSISQMGIITMAIGLVMLAPESWPVMLPFIVFFSLHHGLSKGALFLGVGISGGQSYSQRWWIWLGMWLPALALAGAPWSSGMLAKSILKTQATLAPAPWDSLLPGLLILSSFTTALLMARLLYLVRPGANQSADKASPGMLRPWLVLLLAILLTPWMLAPAIIPYQYHLQASLTGLWPIIAAFLTVLIIIRMGLFRSVQACPVGDILFIYEYYLQRMYHLGRKSSCLLEIFNELKNRIRFQVIRVVVSVNNQLQQTDERLTHWHTSVFLILLVIVLGLVVSVFPGLIR